MIEVKGDIVEERNQYQGLIIPASTQGKFWGQGDQLTRVFPGLKQNYLSECRGYPRKYQPGQCWIWSPLSGNLLIFVVSTVVVSPTAEPLRTDWILKGMDAVIAEATIYQRQHLAMPCLVVNAARNSAWADLKAQITEKFDKAGLDLTLYDVHLAAYAVEPAPILAARN